MKFALASDLHLEYTGLKLKNENNADALILAGDIMVAEDLHDFRAGYQVLNNNKIPDRLIAAQRYRDFLRQVSNEFKHVFYVAGNHELYGGKWNGSIAELRNECAAFNVHFLENDTFTLGNITIAGCTLWTNMYKHDPFVQMNARAFMNDYNLIRVDTAKNVQYYKLSPTDTLKRHDQSLEFLKKTANNMPVNGKMVVVTHHAPSMLSRDPRYMDDILTGCYVSDLSEFILDNPVIKLWCHGHTHTNFDYAIGETRVVCNPRGYVKYEWVKDDFTLHYLTV